MDDARNQASKQIAAERFAGCLLGGAVGDALGAPVEFCTDAEICARFPEGVREFAPAYGRVGAITDDTQMTLFTAEGLIRGFVRWQTRGIGPVFQSTVGHAYLRWLKTQEVEPRKSEIVECKGFLYTQQA